MALSNTTVPIYYGRFRDEVLAGRIPVCREVAMEMNRIDEMIANPNYYYDDGLSAELQTTATLDRDEPALVDGLPVVGWTERAKTEAEQNARLDDLAARVARIEAHLWPARRRSSNSD